MARGGPDYSIQTDNLALYSQDVNELAARTGSIDVIQRAGNVVYTESFENGLYGWYVGAFGATSAKVRYNRGLHKNTALAMTPAIVPPTNLFVSKILPMIDVGNIGLELQVYFERVASQPDSTFRIVSQWYDGNNTGFGAIDLYPARTIINVEDWSTGSSVLVPIDSNAPTLYGDAVSPTYYYVKLVVNVLTGYYMRFYLDRRAYNLSAYKMFTSPAITNAGMIIKLSVTSGATVESVNVTDIIVTVNEPR
jgi:hypothetical protein